jgi:hypothetical protein
MTESERYDHVTLGSVGLIAVNFVLLLLIALGLIVTVLSDQAERRTIAFVLVTGGLSLALLLLCCCTAVALVRYLTAQAPVPAPRPVSLTPTATPSPPVPPAMISLIPDSVTVAQGESISVTIHITHATDLYGVEVHLTHGAGLSAQGLVPGTCATDVVVTPPAADGRIDFAASRMAPSLPFSGDCDVAAFTVTGEAPGSHVVAFAGVILGDRGGAALPVTSKGGTITVVAPTPNPTVRPTH